MSTLVWGSQAERILIGVNELDLKPLPPNFISQLQLSLEKKLPDYSFEFKLLDEQELKKSIETRRLDFVISSSAFFRELPQRGKDIATLVSPYAKNPDKGDGAVILARANEQTVKNIHDLQNKNIGISPLLKGTSFLALLWEIESSSKPSQNYKINLREQDLPLKELLEKLRNGELSAAVLPTCSLENYGTTTTADTSWIRVINRKSDSSFLCVHSTKLFPNLTFFSVNDFNSDLTRELASVLTSLSIDGFLWSPNTNFDQLDRVLKHFNLDPFAHERELTLGKIFEQYWPWAIFFLCSLIGLFLHSVRAEALVQKRTKSLRTALEEKSRIHKQAQQFSKKLERLHKFSTLNQMSSLFAHELRQPLNSIICFAYSLSKGIKTTSQSDLKDGLEEIEFQAKRANEIVKKVRDYVRSRTSAEQLVDLNEIIKNSIYQFESTSPIVPQTKYISFLTPCFIKGDPLELELVFINIFRNAVEAQSPESKSIIDICLAGDQKDCLVTVSDNGPPIKDELLEELSSEIESSKPEGLGLGLSIVRMLLESHRAKIFFEKNKPSGLKVIIKFQRVITQSLSESEDAANENNPSCENRG